MKYFFDPANVPVARMLQEDLGGDLDAMRLFLTVTGQGDVLNKYLEKDETRGIGWSIIMTCNIMTCKVYVWAWAPLSGHPIGRDVDGCWAPADKCDFARGEYDSELG